MVLAGENHRSLKHLRLAIIFPRACNDENGQ